MYFVITGRALVAFCSRLSTNVLMPGYFFSVRLVRRLLGLPTARIGRSPVASDHFMRLVGRGQPLEERPRGVGGAARRCRTSPSGRGRRSSAWLRVAGQDLDAVVDVREARTGPTGPVQSIAILPRVEQVRVLAVAVCRGRRSRSTAICWSSVAALTPAGELNAALVLSELRMSPPACQSSASNRQTVSSPPSLTYAQPNCFLDGSVSFLAARRKSSQRPVGGRVGEAGLLEQLLVVDQRQVVHQGGDADDLVADGHRLPLGRPEVVPVDVRLGWTAASDPPPWAALARLAAYEP